ncbi:MAG: phosphoribosylformylglycinamidine cyclo-ligase, partial [Chloroflexi bacterium]|nr:phosphoribosylformylglycinamidine cyclo-ligase [Chloroflexota bacterium]
MSASTEPSPTPLRYADAGVDVQAAEASVSGLRMIARRASRPEVLGGVGAIAGLLRHGPGYSDPGHVA